MLRKVLIVSIILLSIGGIFYSTQALQIEELRTESLLVENLEPINAKLIQPFLFGHEAFYADLFWINTIQHSTDYNKYDMFNYLYRMIHLITDLDPRFVQVYVWSDAALEYANSREFSHRDKIEKINEILEKGWNYMLADSEGWNRTLGYWSIPQFLGYNYGIELKNREKALEYVSALMNIPDIPPFLKTWAAGLYRDANDKSKGITYLENLYAAETLQQQLTMADDEVVKERLKGKLLAFYKNLESDQYGYQRMEEIQSRVRYMVSAWRSTFNFLPFEFYALLYKNENGLEQMQSKSIYATFFPQLASE